MCYPHNFLITTDTWEPTKEELQQILEEELDCEDEDEYDAKVQTVHTVQAEARLPRVGYSEAEGHAK